MDSFASVEGLPPCPDDMNEVEYASFLFNPLCQVRIGDSLRVSHSHVPSSAVTSHVHLLPGKSAAGYARTATRLSEFQQFPFQTFPEVVVQRLPEQFPPMMLGRCLQSVSIP